MTDGGASGDDVAEHNGLLPAAQQACQGVNATQPFRCRKHFWLLASLVLVTVVGISSPQSRAVVVASLQPMQLSEFHTDNIYADTQCNGDECEVNTVVSGVQLCSEAQCFPDKFNCQKICASCQQGGTHCTEGSSQVDQQGVKMSSIQERVKASGLDRGSFEIVLESPYHIRFWQAEGSENCLSYDYDALTSAICSGNQLPLYEQGNVWRFDAKDDCLLIRNAKSNKCIVSKVDAGRNVFLRPCSTEGREQCWHLNSDHNLVNMKGKCLTVNMKGAALLGFVFCLTDCLQKKPEEYITLVPASRASGRRCKPSLLMLLLLALAWQSFTDASLFEVGVNRVRGASCFGDRCSVGDKSQHNSAIHSPGADLQSQYKQCEGSSNKQAGSAVCCTSTSGVVCCAAAAASANTASTSTDCPKGMVSEIEAKFNERHAESLQGVTTSAIALLFLTVSCAFIYRAFRSREAPSQFAE